MDFAEDVFSLVNICVFIILLSSNLPNLLFGYLKPSFLTHSLQIHCFGLFGPKSIRILGWCTKFGPYIGDIELGNFKCVYVYIKEIMIDGFFLSFFNNKFLFHIHKMK